MCEWDYSLVSGLLFLKLGCLTTVFMVELQGLLNLHTSQSLPEPCS